MFATAATPARHVRGTSADHASIQLADLVAGAGRAVAHFHHRQAGSAAKVGEFLAPVVVPLITANGLFAHDEPIRSESVTPADGLTWSTRTGLHWPAPRGTGRPTVGDRRLESAAFRRARGPRVEIRRRERAGTDTRNHDHFARGVAERPCGH